MVLLTLFLVFSVLMLLLIIQLFLQIHLRNLMVKVKNWSLKQMVFTFNLFIGAVFRTLIFFIMAIGYLGQQLIGMLIGSVVQNSGDKQNDNALVQRTMSELMNKVKKSSKQNNAPKPLLSEFNDTNSM